jgi:DNA-binding CsgD family transcriptional regulator
MSLVPPFGTTVLLTRYADMARPLLIQGINIFDERILFGLLLFIVNLFSFYLYVKLSAAYDTRGIVIEIANPPPLYSSETGLSPAFIKKFDISQREQEIIGAVLAGHRNKEMAVNFHISVSTVENHLRSIYRKTGVSGRSALFALIRP